MKAKFLTKAGRVGHFILFVILLAAEVGCVYIALTGSTEEASIFAMGSVVWIIPAILCLIAAILSGGAELTLERGRLTGRWRGREFSCPLSDVKMLYCDISQKGGDYLYLRTSEGSYHFFGMRNAEEMRDAIAAALPLPADCRNASDEMLADKHKERKKIATRWNLLMLAVLVLLVAMGIAGLVCLSRNAPIYLSVGSCALVMILAVCLSIVSGRAYWSKQEQIRLSKEINRRKIGGVEDYPKGYNDVVKVIYYLDYEARLVIYRTEEGYTYHEEYWDNEEVENAPYWQKDEYDTEDRPPVLATMEELDDYLYEELGILGFDETVWME